MLSKTWWILTFRWLFAQNTSNNEIRKASYLTGASLAVAIMSSMLGVGSLSFIRALVSGFERQLSLGVANFVGPLSYKSGWRSENEHEKIADKLDYPVESYWQGQALLVGPRLGRGVLIEGRRYWKTKFKCIPGALSEVTLGKNLATNLGVKEGDTLKILLPGLYRGTLPARVASITSFGLQELDARRALINDESLRCYLAENGREITGRPGDFLGLRFFPPVDTMSDASLESESFHLRSIITSNLRDSDPEIKTWRSQNRNYFRSIGFDRTVLSIVLGFLTLAASLNVAAALFVIFFERDKDMMTLRAIGMTPGQMKNWILIQGFVMGLVGTALGLGGSYLISFIFEKWKLVALPAEVYHIDHLVFYFDWPEQLGVFIFGILSSLAVAFMVGQLLTRMKIVEVLSHRR